jgi:hypothetical protein
MDLYCGGFEPAELAAISDLLPSLLASDEDADIVSDQLESDLQYFETALTRMAVSKEEQVMA